ncbi:unnamed protein product [Prunus armeniaca]|uniref:SCP domain-containing protein n=1 Tax=Prunus armeniaca TaxID=36596 RepID=A0A6J5Y6W4_PRUAR|nr:hypothetical protein GBA52_028008 [Prunus armeniaca]CAB4291562.1 unnamed protein product [Prunus armeniaca]CAB4321876.1 unnamed protein product [Prunus armeniaca]
MRFCFRKTQLFSTLVVLLILFSCLQLGEMRHLKAEQWAKNHGLALVSQYLARGKAPPSGPNPCTHIPGRGSGICT